MTPNIEALLHGYVSGKFYEWPLLRGEVAALIKERDAHRKHEHELENEIASVCSEDYSLKEMFDAMSRDIDKHLRRADEAEAELDRLRAEQRIPPHECADDDWVTVFRREGPASDRVGRWCRECGAIRIDEDLEGGTRPGAYEPRRYPNNVRLRKQAEPGTAKQSPTESSSSPEATQKEQTILGLPEGFRIARLRRSPSYGRKPPMTLLAELEPIAPQGEPK